MRKDKYKIQIGDILYEASLMRNKVIEYKIVDISVENYFLSREYKVIFKVEYKLGDLEFTSEKYLGDVIQWFDTIEEAEEELERLKLAYKTELKRYINEHGL